MTDLIKPPPGFTGWRTPPEFFDGVCARFGRAFTLDAAADADNSLCGSYLSEERSAFDHSWGREFVWLNPPYSRGIGRWLMRARDMAEEGADVTMLVTAQTDTKWFLRHAVRAAESLDFLTGRIPFDAPPGYINERNNRYSNVLVHYAAGSSYPVAPPVIRWWDWRKDIAIPIRNEAT